MGSGYGPALRVREVTAMLPGMELMGCTDLAVPPAVMRHVVHVESSFNPYAIGVVGGRLARQPRSLSEALSTVRMLEREGYNFSLGLAQVNRHNLAHQGLDTYEKAFETCPNLKAGARILAECRGRAGGDWGKAFSCYYSGNFVTGFQHGYVQKVFASWNQEAGNAAMQAIPLAERRMGKVPAVRTIAPDVPWLVTRRIEEAAVAVAPGAQPPVPATPAQVAAPAPTAPQAALPQADRGMAPVVVQPIGASAPGSSQRDDLQAIDGPHRPATGQGRDTAFVF